MELIIRKRDTEVGRYNKNDPICKQTTNTIWKKKGYITYGRIVCDYRSEKADPNQTWITMGGDLINYPGDCGTPTADLLIVKLSLNSIVLTMGAKFMTIDIKDFYLMTPMDHPKYFRIKLELFPQDIIKQYNLTSKVDDKGYVFCEVN